MRCSQLSIQVLLKKNLLIRCVVVNTAWDPVFVYSVLCINTNNIYLYRMLILNYCCEYDGGGPNLAMFCRNSKKIKAECNLVAKAQAMWTRFARPPVFPWCTSSHAHTSRCSSWEWLCPVSDTQCVCGLRHFCCFEPSSDLWNSVELLGLFCWWSAGLETHSTPAPSPLVLDPFLKRSDLPAESVSKPVGLLSAHAARGELC